MAASRGWAKPREDGSKRHRRIKDYEGGIVSKKRVQEPATEQRDSRRSQRNPVAGGSIAEIRAQRKASVVMTLSPQWGPQNLFISSQ